MLSNLDIAHLLAAEAADATSHRRKALDRASRAALAWDVEAAGVDDLQTLPSVGSSIALRIESWRTDGVEVPEPPINRQGFVTMAWALDYPSPLPHPMADLHTHTNYSDGTVSVEEMVASVRDYRIYAITDHSAGQPIPQGIGPAELARQRREIEELKSRESSSGPKTEVLQGLEMNLDPLGEGDTEPSALAKLDLVIGAFHSKLRIPGDQTDRYLKALLNPNIQILAHPTARKFAMREGLEADWDQVAMAAAHLDKALEFDCNPSRQDRKPEALKAAAASGCRISLGSDAHSVVELGFLRLGLAVLAEAGIPRDRIVNYMGVDELKSWVAKVRSQSISS